MRTISILLLLAIAACGSSTDVKAGNDPSLLFTNNLDRDYVYITWQDGNAIVGRDSIPPHTVGQCVRFTAQPDSAYWSITATESNPNGLQPATANVTAPYFNPTDRPAWNVTVTSEYPGSPAIRATLTDTPC